MGKALFVGLSAAFFTAYSLVATALFVPTSEIVPIQSASTGNQIECSDGFEDVGNGFELPTFGELLIPGTDCYDQEVSRYWGVFGWIFEVMSTTADVVTNAATIFQGFFQLLTFQTGYSGASFLTLIIFTPLAFVNAFIIFGAIRGGGS